ncbi:MAG TPA: methyltransferase domain-containing protein [Solirubrobacteraceae bacterium]|nr:methyltransferase domain-containing protein [Solirubrobacteraceae bacterium]
MTADIYVQGGQPPGVPPLELTGERTLPDVPAENYWFRRHLAVYEWIGARVAGLRVIDMACGEGYGCEVLSRSARSVVGVDANPEAHEHARRRYVRQNLRFERALVETYGEQGSCEAVVFLQTIEHLHDPAAGLAHMAALLTRGGVAYISTPNVLTLAPPGAAKSDNPWHLREYRADEFERLCRGAFANVELLGVFHARRLRAHELALRLGWDRLHPRLGLTAPFYDRFTLALASSDFALRPGRLDRALDFLAVCRCG